jgi:hypothetical protein
MWIKVNGTKFLPDDDGEFNSEPCRRHTANIYQKVKKSRYRPGVAQRVPGI